MYKVLNLNSSIQYVEVNDYDIQRSAVVSSILKIHDNVKNNQDNF
jgi:hypothetical protein